MALPRERRTRRTVTAQEERGRQTGDRRRRVAPLTTTAYAILGVLKIKPRTAYELAAEMRHCFEYFWPRADVRVYAEAKALAARGLVTADTSYTGKRRRTTYAITPQGGQALQTWLASPVRPIALEFEGLVKVYLARFGTREQLLATLAQVQADAAYMLGVATNVRVVYLEGCAPFQDEYVHTWVFVYEFLVDYFRLLHRWAGQAQAVVNTWTDVGPEGKRDAALRVFERKRPTAGADARRRAVVQSPRPLAPDELLARLAGTPAGPDGAVPALPGLWGTWATHSRRPPPQAQRPR